MSTPLAELLQSLRTALGRGVDDVPPIVPSVPGELRPRLPDDASDLTATFIASLRRAGAEVMSASEAGAIVAAAAPVNGPGDPAAADAFALQCTIRHASVAIALSGTVALDSDDALAALSSPTLIVHVQAQHIVADLRAALALLATRPTPASRVLVTGPSKTADIEGVLITGVHGPGRVIVVVA